MKRCLGLLLLLGLLLTVAPQMASAFPQPWADGSAATSEKIELVGERGGFGGFWRRHFGGRGYERGRMHDRGVGAFERRGVGARFWGGPYWGYGARLGHPCDNCRSACVGGESSGYCDRCRMRCGW